MRLRHRVNQWFIDCKTRQHTRYDNIDTLLHTPHTYNDWYIPVTKYLLQVNDLQSNRVWCLWLKSFCSFSVYIDKNHLSNLLPFELTVSSVSSICYSDVETLTQPFRGLATSLFDATKAKALLLQVKII